MVQAMENTVSQKVNLRASFWPNELQIISNF